MCYCTLVDYHERHDDDVIGLVNEMFNSTSDVVVQLIEVYFIASSSSQLEKEVFFIVF